LPDKWEYPAFFAWDLAFHMIPMARIDPDFAKKQLLLLLREWYLHPNGQLPAFEYDLSNVNPAGARLGLLASLQADRRHPTTLFWKGSFTAPDELHLVGQSQGPGRSERL